MNEIASDSTGQKEVKSEGTTTCSAQDRAIHRGLDPSQQQIRLLKICAGNPSIIKCELRHFNFATLPPYRAVSYTWGDPDYTTAIVLNGFSFYVRENLWDFLHVAEDKLRDTWLWIDAMCIDQDNFVERNSQVRMMQDIFGRAEEVLSWTGFAEGGSAHSTVLRMISTGLYSTYSAAHDIDDGEPVSDDEDVVLFEKRVEDTRRFIHFAEKNQFEIEEFLSRPYWQRIWIIQEVRFARKHLVMYGRTAITASKLNQFITSIKYRGSRKVWLTSLPYQYAWAVLNPPSNVAEFSLSNVVRTYQTSLCTDLRDRVYGVMSLVNENVRMEIDYEVSAFELYFLTLGRIVQTEWIYQTKETVKCTAELKLALGLNADDVDDSFVRLFVEHAIRYRPRLLTLENWLGFIERRAKKGITAKGSQACVLEQIKIRESHSLIESESHFSTFGSPSPPTKNLIPSLKR